MKYQHASELIDAIHGAYHIGSKDGLKNIQALLAVLCPDPKVPIIHVAGTNGKGSTCAILESILRAAGYRTGLYTSPFLQVYQERIRISGQLLSDELVLKYGNRLLDAVEQLKEQGILPTPFELGTALALSTFEGEQADIAIVEVGLGGRLDATNVVAPAVCAIAAIGMDHMDFLGDSLEAIAGEKAGIMKEGVPVVCHPAPKNVQKVFRDQAALVGASLTQLKPDDIRLIRSDARGSEAAFCINGQWKAYRLALPGHHQLTNALTVLNVVEQLRQQGFSIPEEAVAQGLAEVRWPARLEWQGNILLDGCHNTQGVKALKAFVQEYLPEKKKILLTGILADKLNEEMLRGFGSLAEQIITVTPDNPRAAAAEDVAALFRGLGYSAQASASLKEGLAIARAMAGKEGIIIAAGSLYLMGQLRNLLGLQA